MSSFTTLNNTEFVELFKNFSISLYGLIKKPEEILKYFLADPDLAFCFHKTHLKKLRQLLAFNAETLCLLITLMLHLLIFVLSLGRH